MRRLGLFLESYRQAGGAAPEDIALSAATIAETAVQGTTVGTLSTVGGRVPIVYTLPDSASDRFQVSGSELQAGSAATDFETGTSHQVTVRATDALGRTFDRDFDISVTDVIDDDEYRDWEIAA